MAGSRGGWHVWRAQHRGKRKFSTRREAWLVIGAIWWRQRCVDSLHPYACTWAPYPEGGRTGEPHIHIGHGKHSPQARIAHLVRKRVVWPYCRARLAVRVALGLRQPPPDWKPPWRRR